MGSVFSSPKMPADDEYTTLAHAVVPRRLQHPQRAQHVDLRVIDGLFDRPRVADRGRQVEITSTPCGTPAYHGRVTHVSLDELHMRKWIQVFAIPGKKVVEHGDLMPFFQQQTHDVGADKSGSAGH